jgi:hypothetical protein
MTLQEFNDEFQFKYDAASNGGPDLNSYEKSICLTQAVRDIIEEAYNSYETNERSKRILAPLLSEHNSSIQSITDDLTNFNCFLVSQPANLHYILREEAKMSNCNTNLKIENTDLDYLTTYLNNPFKRPNNRKVIKVEHSTTQFKIYSLNTLTKFKIKYLRKYSPIILTNLATDPELFGNNTIEGLSAPTNTELPYFIHDEIVDKAVIIAIKITRENNLNTQVQIN